MYVDSWKKCSDWFFFDFLYDDDTSSLRQIYAIYCRFEKTRYYMHYIMIVYDEFVKAAVITVHGFAHICEWDVGRVRLTFFLFICTFFFLTIVYKTETTTKRADNNNQPGDTL